MTEPNKELPKEGYFKPLLPKKVENNIDDIYSEHTPEQRTYAVYGAEICHDHYAPIIEAKDKQMAEKDKRIAELEADVKKVMGLLKGFVISSLHDDMYEHAFRPATKDEVETQLKSFCAENGIDLGGE